MIKLDELMALARECGNIERRHCIGKAQGFDVRNAYAELESALKALVEDAERYQWLTTLKCNSLTLSRDDDHACNYMTASDWIDDHPEWYAYDDPGEVALMRVTNTIWSLQVYPDTPIGSTTWNASTADAAIDAARKPGSAA